MAHQGDRARRTVIAGYNATEDVFVHTSGRTTQGLELHTLTPCRLLDTRLPQDGPALVSGVTETLALHGACGIPATAQAVAVNVTAVEASGTGRLTFYPGGGSLPLASTVNFAPMLTRANNAVLKLAVDGTGTLTILPVVAGSGTVHVILDVMGYFE